jgi:formylglycine-generating enzyme required for sulfatase activity
MPTIHIVALALYLFCCLPATGQKPPKFTIKVPQKTTPPGSTSGASRPAVQPGDTPVRAVFVTLLVTSDLEGTIYAGDKAYPLKPDQEAPVPISLYADRMELRFEGPDSFVEKVKMEFSPATRGSRSDYHLSVRENYLLYLRKLKEMNRTERILDGISRQMVFIAGSLEGRDVRDFEISRYEVTMQQFALFADQKRNWSGQDTTGSIVFTKGGFLYETYKPGINWRHDPFGNVRPPQDSLHPVIHVSWHEANEYCKWLSENDKRYKYRLPTADEWEYAAGCGNYFNIYPWGNEVELETLPGNTADLSLLRGLPQMKAENVSPFDDGFAGTSPAGSFSQNCFSLFDMAGNVAEWTADDWVVEHVDGSRDAQKIIKGGSYFVLAHECAVMKKQGFSPAKRHRGIGFRVVRDPK